MNITDQNLMVREPAYQEKDEMAFVNEYISERDFSEYGLDEIDKEHLVGATKSPDWTIDRDRNIYLRKVSSGREERSRISLWSFYWKDRLVWIERESLGGGKESDGLYHSHARIKIKAESKFKDRKIELEKDLSEAFNAYGCGGVYSKATGCVHDLQFVE